MKVVHKKQQPKNLLFYGDFNCTTGFGKVSKELIDYFKKDSNFNIVVFSINDFNQSSYSYAENVKVIPALTTIQKTEDVQDVYCRLQFLRMLYDFDWDVVFCLNDVEIFNQMGEHFSTVKKEKKKANKKSFKSIIYFPIDSEPRQSDLEILRYFDEVITYTDYAKEIVKNLTAPEVGKKVKVIPHGTNTKEFFPLSIEDKMKAKLELLGEGKEETYLFGSVNRNSARKDYGSLLLGFAMFKHYNETNSAMYLHCNPKDPMGINMYRLCERLSLQVGRDVFFPNEYSENKGTTEEELNRIYNAFDCFVTTTTAEGWGLTISEAMATKTLVICPKHTSLIELTEDGKNTLNFIFQEQAIFVNDYEKIRIITLPSEVKTLLEVAYNLKNDTQESQDAIKQMIEDAYVKATSYKWSDISKQFKTIIDKLSK